MWLHHESLRPLNALLSQASLLPSWPARLQECQPAISSRVGGILTSSTGHAFCGNGTSFIYAGTILRKSSERVLSRKRSLWLTSLIRNGLTEGSVALQIEQARTVGIAVLLVGLIWLVGLERQRRGSCYRWSCQLRRGGPSKIVPGQQTVKRDCVG